MTLPSSNTLPDLIRLDRPKLLVGRGEHVDVRLPHPAVSRRHAELRPGGGAILVRDLRSRTGVLVNGAAVASAHLREDDIVAFGPVSYEVKGGQLRRVQHTEGVRLEARGLGIRLGDRDVLADVTLTIPPNNFVGILGPSGAGKTTLLRALAGHLLPAAGQVFLDGLDPLAHEEVCRAMAGFVPQEDVVYPSLTARENLDSALRLRVVGDLRGSERASWVEHALKRLGLEEHADRPVRTLSGGQRKRVSVAIELLARPRLLFLDEPTAGLDPAAEARLMQFLHDLARRGTTVICTTHVLESLNLFDAVMVVAGGRLLGSGNPQKLLAHFQAGSYAELYEKLERLPPPATPAPTPRRSPAAAAARGSVLTAAFGMVKHTRAGALSQTLTQLHRGALLIFRDRALLALLVGQPLFIGFLITLSQIMPGESNLDLFTTFAVVASIWLGLNNTAREVVRDRKIYVRERRAAVNPESYLLAKVVLFAGIGLVQLILLVFWLRCFYLFDPKVDPGAYQALVGLSVLKFLLVLWVTYLSAMLLGLLISTLAASEEAAVAVLPLVVLPQLLLSAVATDLKHLEQGWFNRPDVVLAHAREAPRRPAGWLLEGASCLTYSRPALVFFLHFEGKESAKSPLGPTAAEIVKWGHLLLLLLLTATTFLAVFLARERRWLRSA